MAAGVTNADAPPSSEPAAESAQLAPPVVAATVPVIPQRCKGICRDFAIHNHCDCGDGRRCEQKALPPTEVAALVSALACACAAGRRPGTAQRSSACSDSLVDARASRTDDSACTGLPVAETACASSVRKAWQPPRRAQEFPLSALLWLTRRTDLRKSRTSPIEVGCQTSAPCAVRSLRTRAAGTLCTLESSQKMGEPPRCGFSSLVVACAGAMAHVDIFVVTCCARRSSQPRPCALHGPAAPAARPPSCAGRQVGPACGSGSSSCSACSCGDCC